MNVSRAPGAPGHDHAACLRAREETAVALLRHHEPSPEVLQHLEACPPCRDEYVELARLPRLLDAVREVRPAEPPEQPRPQLLDRLLDEVGRRRRRRRLTTGGLIAAAVTAAVLVTVPLVRGGVDGVARDVAAGERRTPPSPAPSGTAVGPATTRPPDTAVVAAGSARDPASGADARVDVRPDGAGSAVSISVRGWPEGRPCRMIVHDAAGGAREVGIWKVSADDASTYVEAVDLPPVAIARVELVDDRTGRPMIEVLVRHR